MASRVPGEDTPSPWSLTMPARGHGSDLGSVAGHDLVVLGSILRRSVRDLEPRLPEWKAAGSARLQPAAVAGRSGRLEVSGRILFLQVWALQILSKAGKSKSPSCRKRRDKGGAPWRSLINNPHYASNPT